MAITYTDIRNRKAQADALDAVNSYLVKRQNARKPVEEDKKTVEGAKSLAAFYGKEDEYATQLENIVNLPSTEQNVVLENIYRDIPKTEKTSPPPKTIKGVSNLASSYGLDFTERIKSIGKLPEGSSERAAAISDAYSDITKDQKDEPVQYNLDNLQAGVDGMPEGKKKNTSNRMLMQMRKVGSGAKMFNLYGNKIMNNIAADAEVQKEKDFIPNYRKQEDIIVSQMIAEGRKVNAPVPAKTAPDGSIIEKAKPGWGKFSDKNYVISDNMKKLHRRMREAQLANDLALENIKYTGQVVHKPEDIRVFTDANSGVIGIEDTPWFEKNIKPQVIEYMKQNPGLSDEELTSVIQNIAFELVKERQDNFGATKNPEQYYTLYIDREPDRFEFDKIKNLYEGFGQPLKEPDTSRPQ